MSSGADQHDRDHRRRQGNELKGRRPPDLGYVDRPGLLIVESGPDDDIVPHVRFRRHGAHIWTLEMATHTGAWEPTGFRGQIERLVELVHSDFPWTLEPVA